MSRLGQHFPHRKSNTSQATQMTQNPARTTSDSNQVVPAPVGSKLDARSDFPGSFRTKKDLGGMVDSLVGMDLDYLREGGQFWRRGGVTSVCSIVACLF